MLVYGNVNFLKLQVRDPYIRLLLKSWCKSRVLGLNLEEMKLDLLTETTIFRMQHYFVRFLCVVETGLCDDRNGKWGLTDWSTKSRTGYIKNAKKPWATSNSFWAGNTRSFVLYVNISPMMRRSLKSNLHMLHRLRQSIQ